MSNNSYESGRLNLPFVGHCTFAKAPPCLDWESLDADVAVLGAPNDMGTQWRSGARFGPRSIREASTLFSFGHAGAYDFEDDVIEGMNKRPLDSLSTVADGGKKRRKPHLYRKRVGFRTETQETLKALRYTP